MTNPDPELTPEVRIAALTGVPVTLLPTRLETRFVGPPQAPTELRVRVYPDQVHVDAHQPELTAGEIASGQSYWRNRWAAGAAAGPRRQAAWAELTRGIRPARAAWIVRQLTPTNQPGDPAGPRFPALTARPPGLDHPLTMRALPAHWVLVGYDTRAREILRRWFDQPVAPGLTATAAVDDGPAMGGDEAIDTYLGWAADYAEAVAAGMAVTVTAADLAPGARLAAGFSRLVVVGVDWSATPAAAVAELDALLGAHAVSDGLGFLAPGAPTNNVADDLAAGGPIAIGDPTAPRPPIDPNWSAGRRLTRALGLANGSALEAAPGAGSTIARTASELVTALWPATLGYFAEQLLFPAVSRATIGETRDHAISFLQPLGPLPTLRIGRQPLGVLPVMAAGATSGLDPFARRLHRVLTTLRPMWSRTVAGVPRLANGIPGPGGSEVERVLLAILQRAPWAMRLRYRKAFGPLVGLSVGGSSGLGQAHRLQAVLRNIGFMEAFRLESQPRLVPFAVRPDRHHLAVPFVGPTTELGVDVEYLSAVAASIAADDGREALNRPAERIGSVLEALVRLAALHELDRAAARIGATIPGRPRMLSWPTPEISGVAFAEPDPLSLATTPLSELGGRTLAAEVARLLRVTPGDAALVELSELRDALDFLSRSDPDGLDPALRAYLDACSHRLDAWSTSLASRQLSEVRKLRPAGTHIGGYAWVEDLRPETAPDSLGYVAAPSIDHAATAGVLRSGHLAHRATGHESLDVDLSSTRVARALELLRGVREGVALGVLLGYRLERALRDAGLSLFILPLRTLFPLRALAEASDDAPVESTPPRDVVDAAALLERWRRSEATRAATITAAGKVARVPTSPPDARLAGLRREIEVLAETYDAVGDLVLAEAVHQTVRGQPERAQAATRFLDRQELPTDPDVSATPRTSSAFVHRCVVALGPPTLSGQWQPLAAGDPRAAAEPRLNAWVAQLLGEPAGWTFAGRIVSPDGASGAQATVTLADIRLSPLAILAAAGTGSGDRRSELEERIVGALTATLRPPPGSHVELLVDAPGGRGLAALVAMTSAVARVLRTVRPADARIFDRPDSAAAPGIDTAELGRRAAAAVTTLGAAAQRLDDAVRATTASLVLAGLEAVSRAGVPGAVPPAELGARPVNEPASADLIDFAREAAVLARRRLALAESAAAETGPDVEARHRRTIAAVFGDGQPVLGVFPLPADGDVARSLQPASQQALVAGDPLAAAGWLTRMARVRPELDALWHVLVSAEVATGGFNARQFSIVQLPHRGGRWVGLPFGDLPPAQRPRADVAVVVHTPGQARLVGPMAAMVVDAWTEQIPAATETGGLAFHYDAPSNRAPQVALLAVPPDTGERPWSLDLLLDTVGEAIELSHLRGVMLHELPAVGSTLPALFMPFDITPNVPSIDFDRLAAHAGPSQLVAGKD